MLIIAYRKLNAPIVQLFLLLIAIGYYHHFVRCCTPMSTTTTQSSSTCGCGSANCASLNATCISQSDICTGNSTVYQNATDGSCPSNNLQFASCPSGDLDNVTVTSCDIGLLHCNGRTVEFCEPNSGACYESAVVGTDLLLVPYCLAANTSDCAVYAVVVNGLMVNIDNSSDTYGPPSSTDVNLNDGTVKRAAYVCCLCAMTTTPTPTCTTTSTTTSTTTLPTCTTTSQSGTCTTTTTVATTTLPTCTTTAIGPCAYDESIAEATAYRQFGVPIQTDEIANELSTLVTPGYDDDNQPCVQCDPCVSLNVEGIDDDDITFRIGHTFSTSYERAVSGHCDRSSYLFASAKSPRPEMITRSGEYIGVLECENSDRARRGVCLCTPDRSCFTGLDGTKVWLAPFCNTNTTDCHVYGAVAEGRLWSARKIEIRPIEVGPLPSLTDTSFDQYLKISSVSCGECPCSFCDPCATLDVSRVDISRHISVNVAGGIALGLNVAESAGCNPESFKFAGASSNRIEYIPVDEIIGTLHCGHNRYPGDAHDDSNEVINNGSSSSTDPNGGVMCICDTNDICWTGIDDPIVSLVPYCSGPNDEDCNVFVYVVPGRGYLRSSAGIYMATSELSPAPLDDRDYKYLKAKSISCKPCECSTCTQCASLAVENVDKYTDISGNRMDSKRNHGGLLGLAEQAKCPSNDYRFYSASSSDVDTIPIEEMIGTLHCAGAHMCLCDHNDVCWFDENEPSVTMIPYCSNNNNDTNVDCRVFAYLSGTNGRLISSKGVYLPLNAKTAKSPPPLGIQQSAYLQLKSIACHSCPCNACEPCATLDMTEVDLVEDIEIDARGQISTGIARNIAGRCPQSAFRFFGVRSNSVGDIPQSDIVGTIHCGGRSHWKGMCICDTNNVCWNGVNYPRVALVPHCTGPAAMLMTGRIDCYVLALIIGIGQLESPDGRLYETAAINTPHLNAYPALNGDEFEYMKVKRVMCRAC